MHFKLTFFCLVKVKERSPLFKQHVLEDFHSAYLLKSVKNKLNSMLFLRGRCI